jgi:protein gp37
MSEHSSIEWTNHTFNPWWGCSRKSPACRFCYADKIASRWGHELWRRSGPRRMMSEAYWRNPIKWNRDAEAAGKQALVFCASMADVFEIHPVPEINAKLGAARERLFSLVALTPWLIWQFLTKRPENVAELVPWADEWPENVWLGTSVEDNQRAAERLPILGRTKAKTLFLSCEPLLEDLDLTPWLSGEHPDGIRRPDWVIAGGESGAKARPMHPAWLRSLRDQVVDAEIAFFFKQWGEWAPAGEGIGLAQHNVGREMLVGPCLDDMGHRQVLRRVGKDKAGRLVDGRTWDEYPVIRQPAEAVAR